MNYKDILGTDNLIGLLPELVSIMYQSLAGNIDSLKLNINVEETLKINQYKAQEELLVVTKDKVSTAEKILTTRAEYDNFLKKNHKDRSY